MKKLFLLIFVQIFFYQAFSQQAGKLDSTFKSYGFSFTSISDAKQLPDGKIIVGGYKGLKRLNSDGSLDPTFKSDFGVYSQVFAISVFSDGKMLVAGYLTTSINGSATYLIKLNADGSLDQSFNADGAGPNDQVRIILPQSDGKILIGGSFTSYNGAAIKGVARLNSDGTLDTSFNPILNTGSGSSIYVAAIAVQSDKKILVGGDFNVTGSAIMNFVRLNVNGSLDNNFNLGTGVNDEVSRITVLSSGKIMISGRFTQINNTNIRHIARINSNGSLDTVFNPGSGGGNNSSSLNLVDIIEKPNGKIMIVGAFQYNNYSASGLSLINADGSFSSQLTPNAGFWNNISFQTDGKILVGGQYLDEKYSQIIRLNADYSIDKTFNPGNGANAYIGNVKVLPNGKIIIIGRFGAYDQYYRKGIARLNADGTIDTSFDPGTGFDIGSESSMSGLAVQADGKILVAGEFRKYNGVSKANFARINSDGSLDNSFNTGIGADAYVSDIAVQQDGKIIIAGGFTSFNGVAINKIARLNTDGSLDNSFNPGTGPDSYIGAIAIQQDGKILVGGDFKSFNGKSSNSIVRLNSDGKVDNEFNIGTGANKSVSSICINNGKIYLIGAFTYFNDTYRDRIVCLNSNGSIDTKFYQSGIGGNLSFYDVLVQPNGKILIGGFGQLFRLNQDGSLDNNFSSNIDYSVNFYHLNLQSDGKLLVSGFVRLYDGIQVGNICRLDVGDVFTSTGVMEEMESSFVSAFPNPVNDKLNFSITDFKGELNVKIYTITGVETLTRKIDTNAPMLDLSTLEQGVYIYKITSADGRMAAGRIVKK